MRLNDIFIFEEEQLNEINMSPTNLRQLASQIDARAGMEFEMIVPNVQGEDLEPEYERDDDYDRRARSFDDIEEFFYDGDYNGRGDIRRLMDAMREDYESWKMERIGDDWMDEGIDFLRDYIANNDMFDREAALDQARDEVIDANPDLPPESEDFQQLINARINELEEQYVQQEWEDGINGRSHVYDSAFEEFTSEKAESIEEQDWLQENTPYMSDVESNYDIQWPYYYNINDGQGGEMSTAEVADDFSEAVGKPITVGSSYHSATRRPGHYVVEPDGSLEADDPNDGGLEFVSPPMPVAELFDDLRKVKEWADRYGCYTNTSTGLHMNISVPSLKGSIENLDYVKLAVLLGDRYILEKFNRSSNTYTKSALDKVQDLIRRKPEDAKALLDQMKGHLADLASKSIHTGITDKYTSINTKGGYVEFRSPGEDWLGKNFDMIENTMLRFVVALDAACDPEKYRQEYLKKLYLLLEPTAVESKGKDTIKYFADYVAGNMPKAALRSFVKQAQLERSVAKGKVTGPMWWVVTNPANNAASIEVVANNKQEAIASAVLPGNYPEWARVQNTLQARPLRPYTAPAAKTNQPEASGQGNWGIWISASERFARVPGNHPAGQEIPLRRFPSQEAAAAWLEQHRRETPGVRRDLEIREIPADYVPPPPAGRVYNPNQAQQQAAQAQTGRYTYRIYTDSNQTVGTFQSDGIQGSTAANIAFRNYLSSIGRDSAAGFNYEEIGRERQAPQAQPAQQAAPQQQTFTGQWDVVMGGEVVFRVRGETQSEANANAHQWILGRSREFLHDHEGQDVEVVPRYE